jgi:hypothetical protein
VLLIKVQRPQVQLFKFAATLFIPKNNPLCSESSGIISSYPDEAQSEKNDECVRLTRHRSSLSHSHELFNLTKKRNASQPLQTEIVLETENSMLGKHCEQWKEGS